MSCLSQTACCKIEAQVLAESCGCYGPTSTDQQGPLIVIVDTIQAVCIYRIALRSSAARATAVAPLINLEHPNDDVVPNGLPIAAVYELCLIASANDAAATVFDDMPNFISLPGVSHNGRHADYELIINDVKPELIISKLTTYRLIGTANNKLYFDRLRVTDCTFGLLLIQVATLMLPAGGVYECL